MHEALLYPKVIGEQGFAKADDACLHGRGDTHAGNKENAAATLARQMIRGEVPGAAIVDADEIVVASLRERKNAAVEQDHWNLRFVQRFHDRVIGAAPRSRDFERREKDPGNSALDELLAEAPGLLFFCGAGGIGAAPEQTVIGYFGRVGHSLTNGLEDFGFAEVGNKQTEKRRTVAGAIAHVGAGTSDALDEAEFLQFTNSAANRNSRSAEKSHQSGFTWKFLAGGIFAGSDVLGEAIEDLAVLRTFLG